MSEHESEEFRGPGIPVFIEQQGRAVSDAVGPATAGEWHPANAPAFKLWACVEAARDIDDILGDGSRLSVRRLKVLVTPLESLRLAITRLGNYLLTSPEVKNDVGASTRQELAPLLDEFSSSSVFRQPADLSLIRDKLSAHVDRKMESWIAQEYLAPLSAVQVGNALHACLAVLFRLLELEIYAWTASDCPDGFIRLMAIEPSLVTLQLDDDGQPVALARLDIARSPRFGIADLLNEIAEKSQWMFPVEP